MLKPNKILVIRCYVAGFLSANPLACVIKEIVGTRVTEYVCRSEIRATFYWSDFPDSRLVCEVTNKFSLRCQIFTVSFVAFVLRSLLRYRMGIKELG